MTEYEFPLRTARSFVERLDQLPPGAEPRGWVIRDDNLRHYPGRVPSGEDPLFLELFWKANARSREQRVGLFRLSLGALVEAGYARRGREDSDDEVRLRFYRDDRGVIVIQVRQGDPALAIGTVDRSAG